VENDSAFHVKNPLLSGSLKAPIGELSTDAWIWMCGQMQPLARGQGSKVFFAPLGGLYATLVCLWPNLSTSPPLSLLTALAVAEVLDPSCTLKWINDVYLGDKKLGGVLIHRYLDGDWTTCVISMGLNINTTHLCTPEHYPIASLAQHTGHTLDLSKVSSDIRKRLGMHYSETIALGGEMSAPTCASINSRLGEYGKKVLCTTPFGTTVGLCQGVAPSGRIILDSGKEYDAISLCVLDKNGVE
jgi:biotin-(acetyl-CoA carboxylase) ligase